MSIDVTFLEQDRQSPAEIAALLTDFINGSRVSLHLAIYDFRLGEALAAPVVAALRARAAAGIDVRIVYDKGKPHGNEAQTGGDPAPPGTSDFVRKLGTAIASKPITGGDPQQPRLMHHKYLIRDGKTPAGAVWTGSTNLTDDAWTIQENNIIRIESPELCHYFETDFDELWTSGDIATTGTHDTGTVQAGSARISVAFAPGEGRTIDADIAHHISAAQRRVVVCSMLLTSGGILGALADTLHRGRVREFSGLYDRTQMESVFDQWHGSPAEWKIPVFGQVSAGLTGKHSTPYAPHSRHDFMHNKIVVCDDVVITGSYNLSHSAIENAENMVMVKEPALADRYCEYIQGLVRRYGEK